MEGSASTNEQQLIEKINRILSGISECDPLIQNIKNEDVVLLLGNLKAGKSSLCHYLIGNQLSSVIKKRSGRFSVVVDEQAEGPKIGEQLNAQTTLPTSWHCGIGILIDAPGFNDNRGEVQDIINAYYIKRVVNNAKSVKFILVCNINDILGDNINGFIDVMDRMHTLLPTMDNYEKGVGIIFTKDSSIHTVSDVREVLKEIYDNKELQMKKTILNDFVHTESNNVGFFRAPVMEGIIDYDIGTGILHVIQHTQKIQQSVLGESLPAVSEKSRIFLLLSQNIFLNNQDYLDFLKSLVAFYQDKTELPVHNQVQGLWFKNELDRIKRIVNDASSCITGSDCKLSDVLKALTVLADGDNDIERAIIKVTVLFNFVEFSDEILRLERSSIIKEYFTTFLLNISHRINLIQVKLKHMLGEISLANLEREIEEVHRSRAQKMAQKQNNLVEHGVKIAEEGNRMLSEMGVCQRIGYHLDETAYATLELMGHVKRIVINAFLYIFGQI